MCAKSLSYRNILKLSCRQLTFIPYKNFLKSKKRSRIVSLPHFFILSERTFKIKQKAFFITFKGFSLKQIKQIFLDVESSTLSNKG